MDSAINDHGDPGYVQNVITRFVEHDHPCSAMFNQLSAGLNRFADYRIRLAAAIARLRAGDAAAFAKPMSASYHCVWMELHQDLLLTLGRKRSQADGH